MGTTVFEVVDSVADECDVCVAFEKAPHLSVAGTPLAPAFNEKVQVELLSSGNEKVRADLFPRYWLLVLASPESPSKARSASPAARITVFR